MKRTIQKSRKEHICECCECKIPKGSTYELEMSRLPVLDDDCNQLGIEYVKYRTCKDCVFAQEQERLPCFERQSPKPCAYVDNYVQDGYVGGHRVYLKEGEICTNCNHLKQ